MKKMLFTQFLTPLLFLFFLLPSSDAPPSTNEENTSTTENYKTFAPVALNDNASTTLNTPVTINVLANDNDPTGNLALSSLSIYIPPPYGTATANPDGTCTYTPDTGFYGTETFQYKICNDDIFNTSCDQATVTITVSSPINLPPSANNDFATTPEDTPVVFDIIANDSDLDGNIDPSTLEINDTPLNGTATILPNGEVIYTPDPDFYGIDSFNYTVCDDGTPLPTACDDATVTIIVEGVNDPPIANDDVADTPEDTPVTIPVTGNDYDEDGNIDPTTILIKTPPSNGTATANSDGTITCTPAPGFTGTDTFTYEVCDDGTPLPPFCDIATVTINIYPVNNPPVANGDVVTTSLNTSAVVDVLANDFDPDEPLDPCGASIVQNPSNGTIVKNPAPACTFTYTPDPDFCGTDTFSYEICDSGGLCDEGTASVEVGNNCDQEYYYYSDNQRIDMELSDDMVSIKFVNGLSFSQKSSVLNGYAFLEPLTNNDVLPAPDITLARITAGTSANSIQAGIDALNNDASIYVANPSLTYTGNSQRMVLTDELIIHVAAGGMSTLTAQLNQLNINVAQIYPFNSDVVIASASKNSQYRTLEAVNYLVENNHALWAQPNFIGFLETMTNDPLYSRQWALENTGTALQYNGNADADMDVDLAWNKTKGCSDISIAIIDEGVDLSHPDLVGNLLPGYDATGLGSNGGAVNDDAHGTACAGIAAASGNNGLGIAGVAYNAKIIPIRITYKGANISPITQMSWMAAGIDWAIINADADILSNSWGGYFYSTLIDMAITNAATNGRGGKGSPVLASTGNNDNGVVGFPASHPDVIAVGAMSMCNERIDPNSCNNEGWGSNYGTNLDVVAPGIKIATTDITGLAGYTLGNYNNSFGGTSAACPNAAGVMALILSTNSNLTSSQAREALERSAVKAETYTYAPTAGRPNGDWNNEMGYGSVNANDAIQYVIDNFGFDAFDIYMKDSSADTGDEPNTVSPQFWASRAIKVSQTMHVNLTNPTSPILQGHFVPYSNPRYGSTNYVYLELTNRGCEPGGKGDKVEVFFSKASAGLTWPNNWMNYKNGTNIIHGDEIGSQVLNRDILPGEKVTIRIPWTNVPNPQDFNVDKSHFCLYARFDSALDGMQVTEDNSINSNAKNNNNVVWRNVNILDINGNILRVAVNNINEDEPPIDLILRVEPEGLLDFAQVKITPDNDLNTEWVGGPVNMNALGNNSYELLSNEARMNTINAPFDSPREVDIEIIMTEPYEQMTMDSVYTVYVIQYDPLIDEEVGGVAMQFQTYVGEILPEDEPFDHDGFTFFPIGDALISIDSLDNVAVEDIGNTGDDGVGVHLTQADFVVVTLDGFDYNVLPEGATKTVSTYGSVEGIPDQAASSLKFTATTEGTLVEADFSPLEPYEYGIKIYNGQDLLFAVAEATLPPIPVVGGDDDEDDDVIHLGLQDNDVKVSILQLSATKPINLDGTPYQGNKIVYTAKTNLTTDYLSDAKIVGKDLGQVNVLDVAMGMFHHEHKAIGETKFVGQEGQLHLLDMGANGGTTIQTGRVDSIETMWSLFDVDNLPTGASITIPIYGAKNDVEDQLLANIYVEDVGTVAAVNFEFFDESQQLVPYEVTVRNGPNIVATEILQPGDIMTMATEGCGATATREPLLADLGMGTPVTITLPGNTVIGQYLSASPIQDVGEVDYISGFGFETVDVGRMTILNERSTQQASRLDVKAFLAGPYESSTGLMRDDLRAAGLLPSSYNISADVLAVTGPDAVVDLVQVEFRDRIDPTIITSTIDVLLQRDGDLVGFDGLTSPLVDLPEGSYYIAIRHRNHLGTMTAQPVAFGRFITSIDFSDPSFLTYGNNAQANLTATMALKMGDTNNDGVVDASDRGATWNNRNSSAFLGSDCNMDGVTDASDRGITWNYRNSQAQLP